MSTRRRQTDPDEQSVFEKSLREHGQLAEEDAETLPPGATHQIETTDEGERKVVRKRYSAI